jgi:transcriptional regulator with XRE-family HTH domain
MARSTPELAFAKALYEARITRGISQEALGFECGYHRTYMSMMERGRVNPSLCTILSIGAALEIPAYSLVQRVEQILGKPWRKAN